MATIDLTESTFEQTVTDNDIVLIDFWAEWCGPCKMFGPIYDKVSENHPDIVFGKVDTDAEQGLAAAANISSIPTLMALRDRTLVFAQPGAMPAEQLEDLISKVRDLDMDQVRATQNQDSKNLENPWAQASARNAKNAALRGELNAPHGAGGRRKVLRVPASGGHPLCAR